ncbi:MAG: ABC transporter substrate-binding protein [Azospirillaceae bacterium]
MTDRPTGSRPATARRTGALATGALAAGLLAAAGQAAAKDTLVIGMPLEPPHLDPTAGAAAAIDEVVYANLFESLTRIDETGAVNPGLAESWDVSEDGLVYTFHLREGVTYHDGTAFAADDVKFALDRARAEESTNAQKGYFAAIDTVTVVDDRTVEVRLSRPDGLFLFNMGSGDAAIVAPESAATNTTEPVGTGPYRFADRVEGDRIALVRDPDYTGPDDVYFERVIFRFVPDPAAQVAGLLAGDIDVVANIGAPESLARFEADDRFALMIGTTEGETVMSANWRREPFDDPRVRQAIMHAVDRQAIVDGAMFGYGTPIGSHFAPHNPAYVDLTDLYPHDPERARALLAEAGLADGFEAEMLLPPPSYARRGGEIIQAQLAEVGIEVELVPVEWAQWLEQAFQAYDYDLTIVSHTEPLDIGIYARGPDDYYFGYDSEAFDAVIAELDATTDPGARDALYEQAQTTLGEDLAAIFLFQLAKTGVRSANVEGMWENQPIQANDVTGARWVE